MAYEPGKACVLLLNLPVSSFCGIDLISFTTSSKFQGIKQVPEGWHFVFTGVNDTFSIRHGFWFHVAGQNDAQPELIIRKWDAELEELVPEQDEATLLKWRANLGNIYQDRLTPYRYSAPADPEAPADQTAEVKEDWNQLTAYITASILNRILGDPNNTEQWNLTSASSALKDADNIPGLTTSESKIKQEKNLEFIPINLKRTWREGAVGRERTEAAQDRSWALNNLIETFCDEALDVIGELQFSFLMVLTLNNNSCLEQWKRILGLLLTCRSMVAKSPTFFVNFLKTLRLQLEHCQDAEGALFDLSDEGATLLKNLLKKFRQGLEQQSGINKIEVMDELEDIEDFLKQEHGWLVGEPYVKRGTLQLEDGEEIQVEMNGGDAEDESGEYAPALVDLTPEQAEQLGLPGVTAFKLNHRNRPKLVADENSDDDDDIVDPTQEHDIDDQINGTVQGDEEEEDGLDEMDARY